MSSLFYRVCRFIGRPIVFSCMRCQLMGAENLPARGGFFLAANHESFYDAMLVSGLITRPIRWLSGWQSVVPLWKPLLRGLDVIPVGLGAAGVASVKSAISHVEAGGIVGFFPEGEIRPHETSVLLGGIVDAKVFKLARLAQAPVIPCVMLGSNQFNHWRTWLPFSGRRCVVALGGAIDPGRDDVAAAYEKSMRELFLLASAELEN